MERLDAALVEILRRIIGILINDPTARLQRSLGIDPARIVPVGVPVHHRIALDRERGLGIDVAVQGPPEEILSQRYVTGVDRRRQPFRISGRAARKDLHAVHDPFVRHFDAFCRCPDRKYK